MGASPGPVTPEFLEWSALFWRHHLADERARREQERASDWRTVMASMRASPQSPDFDPDRVIATDADGSVLTSGDWRKLFPADPEFDGSWASSWGEGGADSDARVEAPAGMEALFGPPGAPGGPPPPPDGWEDTRADFWFLYYCSGCQAYWDKVAILTEGCEGSGCKIEIQNCRYDDSQQLNKCVCERVCLPDGEGADNGCSGNPVPFDWGPCPLVPSSGIDWGAAADAAAGQLAGLVVGALGPTDEKKSCAAAYPNLKWCGDDAFEEQNYKYMSADKAAKAYGRDCKTTTSEPSTKDDLPCATKDADHYRVSCGGVKIAPSVICCDCCDVSNGIPRKAERCLPD